MQHSHQRKPSGTKAVETFFRGYAASFDSIYGHTQQRTVWQKMLDRYFRRSMQLRFELVMQYAAANADLHTILDVGCGGGVYCLALAQLGKTVTGLDIAGEMLALAQEKTKGLSNKVQYVHSGYLEHRFAETFDAALLMGFFDYVQEPIVIFKKLEREVSKELWMSFPKAGGLLAWQRKIRYQKRNCPLYYYTQADLTALFLQMGWQNKAEIISIERDFFVRVRL